MDINNIYNIRVERKGKIIYINFEDEKIDVEKKELKIKIKSGNEIIYDGVENLFSEYIPNKYKYDINLKNNGSYIIENDSISNIDLECYFTFNKDNIVKFNIPQDIAPPGKIIDLKAESYEKYIKLKWTDPEDYDWYGTKLYRWENEEPSFSYDENDVILNGNYKLILDYNERNLYSDEYLDFDIISNNIYYYKCFTYDYDNNYNIECNVSYNAKNDTTEPNNIKINQIILDKTKVVLDINFDALNDINAFKICKQYNEIINMFEDNRFLEIGKINGQFYIYDVNKIQQLFNQRSDLPSNFLDDFYTIKEPIFSLNNFSILKKVYDEFGNDLIFDPNIQIEDFSIENGKTYYYKIFSYNVNEIINVGEGKSIYIDIEKPIYPVIVEENEIGDSDDFETDYDDDNIGIEDKLSYYCDKKNAYIKFWDQNYVINLYNGDKLIMNNITYNQYKYDYCFLNDEYSNSFIIKYEKEIKQDNNIIYDTILTNSDISIINNLYIDIKECLNDKIFQTATLIKVVDYNTEVLNTYNNIITNYNDQSNVFGKYKLILDNKEIIPLDDYIINQIGLKWNDDIINWNNTKIVRKEGNIPNNYNDGIIVLDNYDLNKYSKEYFVDSDLEQNKTYFYKIYTFNKDGVATALNENIQLTLLPNEFEHNVKITNINNIHQHIGDDEYSGIKISWEWNNDNIIGIKIIKSDNDFTESLDYEIEDIKYDENNAITSFIDTNVKHNNIYYYGIYAYDKYDNYNYNNKICYKYEDNYPPILDTVKDSIKLTALSPNKIQIDWKNTECKDLKYITLIRNTINSNEKTIYKLYDNVGRNLLYMDNRTDDSFVKDIKYYYNIIAYDACNNNSNYIEKSITLTDMSNNLKKINENIYIKTYVDDEVKEININNLTLKDDVNILVKDKLDIKFRCYEDVINLNWNNLEYYDNIYISLYENDKNVGILESISKDEVNKFDRIEYVIDNNVSFVDNYKDNFKINIENEYYLQLDYYKNNVNVDSIKINNIIKQEDMLKFDEFNFNNYENDKKYKEMIITYSIDNPQYEIEQNNIIYEQNEVIKQFEYINDKVNIFLHDIYFNLFYVDNNGQILDSQHLSLNNSNDVQLMDYYYDSNNNKIDKTNCDYIQIDLINTGNIFICKDLANRYAPTLQLKIENDKEYYDDIDENNYYSINLGTLIDNGNYRLKMYMRNGHNDMKNNSERIIDFEFKKNNFVLQQIDNIKNSIKANINNNGLLEFKWNDNYNGIDRTIIYMIINNEKTILFDSNIESYYNGQYKNIFKVINEYNYSYLKNNNIIDYEFHISDINNNVIKINYQYIPDYILDSNIIDINYTINKELFNDRQIEISWRYPHNIVNFEKLNIEYSYDEINYKQLKVVGQNNSYKDGYIIDMDINKAKFYMNKDDNIEEENKLYIKYLIEYDNKKIDDKLIIKDTIEYSDKWAPTNCNQASIMYSNEKNIIKFSLPDDLILYGCKIVRKEDSNPIGIYDGDLINNIYKINKDNKEIFIDNNNDEIFNINNESINDLILNNINIAKKGNTIFVIDDVKPDKHYYYSIFVYKNQSVLNNGMVYDTNNELIYLNIKSNEIYTYYAYDINILIYSHDNKIYINWKDAKFEEWYKIRIIKKYNKDNFESENVLFDSTANNYQCDKYSINYFVDEENFSINDRYLYIFETYDNKGNRGKILQYVDYNNITNII